MRVSKAVLMVVLGLIGLIIGARLVVAAAVTLARGWGNKRSCHWLDNRFGRNVTARARHFGGRGLQEKYRNRCR